MTEENLKVPRLQILFTRTDQSARPLEEHFAQIHPLICALCSDAWEAICWENLALHLAREWEIYSCEPTLELETASLIDGLAVELSPIFRSVKFD